MLLKRYERFTILTYTNVKAASNPVLLELPIIIPILLSTIVSQPNPDKDAEKRLPERQQGVDGPSIRHGMLFVTADAPASVGTKNEGGDVIAFDLPPSAVENHTQSIANITK
jgi:hypothetical protein